MAAAVPTVEPSQIYAGDSIHFTKTLGDYSAATWTLSYRLLSQKGQTAIDIAATATGTGFDIAVASATTAAWTEGLYYLIGFVTSGTDRVQVHRSEFTVLPNPAASTHFDGRTYLQRILAILEEVIENGVIRETIRYSYAGQSTEVVSLKDALDARDRIKAQILAEQAAESGKNRRVLTKFTTPR